MNPLELMMSQMTFAADAAHVLQLLAMNAMLDAARVGDSGRELASQLEQLLSRPHPAVDSETLRLQREDVRKHLVDHTLDDLDAMTQALRQAEHR